MFIKTSEYTVFLFKSQFNPIAYYTKTYLHRNNSREMVSSDTPNMIIYHDINYIYVPTDHYL